VLGPEWSALISAYGDADLNTGFEIAVTVQATIDRPNNRWDPAARERESWLMAITLRGRVRRSKLNHQPADTAYPLNSSRKQVEGSYPAESCPNAGGQ
jgi:hypothetical protein